MKGIIYITILLMSSGVQPSVEPLQSNKASIDRKMDNNLKPNGELTTKGRFF